MLFQNAKECKASRGVGGPTSPKCCGLAGQPYFIYNAYSHKCSAGKVSEITSNSAPQNQGFASVFNSNQGFPVSMQNQIDLAALIDTTNMHERKTSS